MFIHWLCDGYATLATELYTYKTDFIELRNQKVRSNMADFESILVVSFRVVARSILQNKVSAQEVWD